MKIFNGFEEYNEAAKVLVAQKKGYDESKGICEKYKNITKEVLEQYLLVKEKQAVDQLMLSNAFPLFRNIYHTTHIKKIRINHCSIL